MMEAEIPAYCMGWKWESCLGHFSQEQVVASLDIIICLHLSRLLNVTIFARDYHVSWET